MAIGSFNTPLACGDTASICYADGNTTYESFTVDNPGDWIQIEFISGTVEVNFDELTVNEGVNGSYIVVQ